MTSLAWRGGAAVFAAAALQGCAPALDWRDVRPAGSGAVLLFPCKPSVQERPVALAGVTVRLALHACSAGGLTWGLAHAEMTDPSLVGPALAALRAAAARNLGATPAALAPLAIAGATPHPESGSTRLEGRTPAGAALRMQVVVCARGTQVIQASVLGEALPEEAVQTFIGSIRFER